MLRLNQFCIFVCLLSLLPRVHSQTSDCKKQAVIVGARDKHGEFVSTLQAADFRAKIHGRETSVVSATRGTGARRLVMVLDASGSMVSKWRRGSQAASSEIIGSSPETTQFALIIFAGRVLETIGFGHYRQEILSAISSFADFPREGRTALRDSLLNAGDLLQPAQGGDAVVVISDGDDNASKASDKAVRKAYLSNGTRFFLLKIVDRYPWEQPTFGDNEFELLSTATGGNVISFGSPNDVPAAAQEIAHEIANYYLLQIELPDFLQKDASLQLDVVDSSGRKRTGVELTFPQKLLPCATLSGHP